MNCQKLKMGTVVQAPSGVGGMAILLLQWAGSSLQLAPKSQQQAT